MKVTEQSANLKPIARRKMLYPELLQEIQGNLSCKLENKIRVIIQENSRAQYLTARSNEDDMNLINAKLAKSYAKPSHTRISWYSLWAKRLGGLCDQPWAELGIFIVGIPLGKRDRSPVGGVKRFNGDPY